MTHPTNHFFTPSLSIDQHLSRIEFDPRLSYDQDREPSEAQRRITKTGLLIVQRTWPRLEDLPTLHVVNDPTMITRLEDVIRRDSNPAPFLCERLECHLNSIRDKMVGRKLTSENRLTTLSLQVARATDVLRHERSAFPRRPLIGSFELSDTQNALDFHDIRLLKEFLPPKAQPQGSGKPDVVLVDANGRIILAVEDKFRLGFKEFSKFLGWFAEGRLTVQLTAVKAPFFRSMATQDWCHRICQIWEELVVCKCPFVILSDHECSLVFYIRDLPESRVLAVSNLIRHEPEVIGHMTLAKTYLGVSILAQDALESGWKQIPV
ncbi:hypothetical protein M231_06758 [Tremella mesenterica]|uniref:Uncharacterized protein n=1 Tax=Tremella mesenterica TaxID=5217 RepID=A0A4Q1BB17_TREME|nr:hypothetical protein M231_06758 [Tremella mesenterica]